MSHNRNNIGDGLPPLPVSAEKWSRLREVLGLTPQQERIVELMLRGLQDKQIAAHLCLKLPTVRTHARRAYKRLVVEGRTDMILKLFAMSHEV